MLADRFAMKDVKRSQSKKDGKGEEKEGKGSKNQMKSTKFFKKMEEIAKSDAAKKESRKNAKLE